MLNRKLAISVQENAQSEVGYISAGKKISKPFLSQPHQIVCAPDGRVICTNTGRNVVTVIDLEKPGIYQEVGVSPVRWDRLSLDAMIGDHINSVFLKNDQLFVVCHRFNKGSQLATLSYPSLELISLKNLSGFTGLHNIWVTEEEQYISCYSETGSIVNVVSGDVLWQAGSPIYTRGLAASNEYIVVGESQKTGRDIRGNSLSALWILERQSWRVMDYIALGQFGCVNEVRLLDVADEAHHGYRFENLDQLLADCNNEHAALHHTRDRSLEHNTYEEITKQAIAQSVLATKAIGGIWKDYNFILDAAITLADGSKKVDKNALCLAILRHETNLTVSSFAFDYELSLSEEPSHVSAVLGYHGSFDDTHMHIILLQRMMNDALLSILQHNGSEWITIRGLNVKNLPLSGTMKVTVSQNDISVEVQQKEVLRLPPARIGLEYCNGELGIRWSGATVKPIKGTN
ncbi:hypothetical protein [Legionella fallonii]|nr:hypothetical protein [Legionella fallonii]